LSVHRIPVTIVHYGRFDPRRKTGGVETFARNLQSVFAHVEFLTTESTDAERRSVMERNLPVVCDNQLVLDWPDTYPVIGFQHGVALRKVMLTHTWTDARLAWRQMRASRRSNTTWVACAHWISREFGRLFGNAAQHVVYHQVDVERFDGDRSLAEPRLILHDGRSPHKGKHLFERLVTQFPDWRFESLSCPPDQVPQRMKQGTAFMHLSRYEGNSIVCNEAMAMNLPCLFTDVGLMRDGQPLDVKIIPAADAFRHPDRLQAHVAAFLASLEQRVWEPRKWTMEHATPAAHRRAWSEVMRDMKRRHPQLAIPETLPEVP
jgi:hypothetical protein